MESSASCWGSAQEPGGWACGRKAEVRILEWTSGDLYFRELPSVHPDQQTQGQLWALSQVSWALGRLVTGARVLAVG